jgi:branched-chain amino acid transport system substrate-binding protein
LNQINESGGVLGRPLEAYYADNACKPDLGVPAVKRLIEREHVPVIIGALCTPVTHAIMPVVQDAKIPLVIATSAGQDFVDASGSGGNEYAFKTIPSELDIARGLIRYLAKLHVHIVAVVAQSGRFPEANAAAMAKAAREAGMTVTAEEIVKPDQDMNEVLSRLKAGSPSVLLSMMGSQTTAFFKAYEASGWTVPVSGRVDFQAALTAVSPEFREAGHLADLTSAVVFSPVIDLPKVQEFVQAYEGHYQLVPTQRSFFVYEAVLLVADAIKRAGADNPAAIEDALKTTKMPSLLGGTYAMDDHNHAHTPIFILGLRREKPAVIATE